MMKLTLLIALCLVTGTLSCSSEIPEHEREDCHPEWGASPEACAAKGCVWCESINSNVPWCFYDEAYECPGWLPDDERVDCYPESGSNEQGCYDRGCTWCPTVDGFPWCFFPAGYSTSSPPTGTSLYCPGNIPEDERIDCYPGGGSTEQGCYEKQCFWCASSTPGVPWCYYNSTGWPSVDKDPYDRVDCMPDRGGQGDYFSCTERGCAYGSSSVPEAPTCFFPDDYGYHIVDGPNDTPQGIRISLERHTTGSLFGDDFNEVTVDFEFQTENRVRIKFYSPGENHFEVPMTVEKPDGKASETDYTVEVISDPAFAFKIIRKSTGTAVFDTSVNGFVFSKQFLQIATRLPASKVYGWGEHEHHHYQHDMNWLTWGMYARDEPPGYMKNLYGTQPMYMGLEPDNNAYGVFFLNSAAQDVTLTPGDLSIYRTIGGLLDMYVFLGPTPENVVQQYTKLVGRTFLPPYWSLGFQLCRYGYDYIEEMQAAVDRTTYYDIPQDVQFGDIDIMRTELDFTYDTDRFHGLPQYIEELKSNGIKFITILDPCISTGEPPGEYPPFDIGNELGVWVNHSDGVTPVLGKVWPPDPIYFPDYSNPVTQQWWIDEIVKFVDLLNWDGLWIDMNEPANFVSGNMDGSCPQTSLNFPPYRPKILGDLHHKTMCPEHLTAIGNMYDTHNLYGWAETEPTLRAIRQAKGKRSMLLSRSTFAGSGNWAAHWLGDNWSQWDNLYFSIIGMLEFNLFGIPYVGADICGFINNAEEEMCQRWHQLGAFYPYSRNHNGYGYNPQDPGYWGPTLASSTRKALLIRYELLPYLYTLFYDARVHGNTVVRALFHEFINDEATHTIDEQFLWGPGFMISPVLYEGHRHKDIYFTEARWYNYYDGSEIFASKQWVEVSALLDFIPLHVRGGYILPTQQGGKNTEITRHLPFGLIIALDGMNSATGSFFYDDGDSIDTIESGDYFHATYTVQNGFMTTTVNNNGYSDMASKTFGTVRIFGVKSTSGVQVNGNNHYDYNYNAGDATLTIYNINVPANSEWTLTF